MLYVFVVSERWSGALPNLSGSSFLLKYLNLIRIGGSVMSIEQRCGIVRHLEASTQSAGIPSCRETHVLIELPSISICRAHNENSGLFSEYQDWFLSEPFARESPDPQRVLLRKTIVPGSARRSWEEQLELLSSEERVPTANSVVLALVVAICAGAAPPFKGSYVRTATVVAPGHHVCVGYSQKQGIEISMYWRDTRRIARLGLAAERIAAC